MDQSSGNLIHIISIAFGMFALAALFKWLSRKQQPASIVHNDAAAPRVVKYFPGRRVYSVFQSGKRRWILHFICICAAILPLAMFLVYWRSLAGDAGGAGTGQRLNWILPAGATIWSILTIVFLRAMFVYRSRTTITLTPEGVHYFAPKVGLFPRRDLFMPWREIDGITPCSLRQPTLIQVFAGDRSFIFDAEQTREIAGGMPDDEIRQSSEGNSLYRDLLEYSGLSPALGNLPLTDKTPANIQS